MHILKYHKIMSMAQDEQQLSLTKPLSKKDRFIVNMLNSAHRDDCWVITDPDGNDNPIVYASPGFRNATGYSYEEMVGRNCRFLQGDGTNKEEVSKIKFATEHDTEASANITNYRKDGTPFHNEFFVTPLHTEEGAPAYFLSVQFVDGAPNLVGSG